MMRKAFTLMEVNLAILIMATGVLAIVSLYAFGYRENRQSRDDVAATAFADAVISPLVMALGSTNITWKTFNELKCYPGDKPYSGFKGWGEYLDGNGQVRKNPDSLAASAYEAVMRKLAADAGADFPTKLSSYPGSSVRAGLQGGLVIQHEPNSGTVGICFRACAHARELISMPAFYTEVRFQGIPELAREEDQP